MIRRAWIALPFSLFLSCFLNVSPFYPSRSTPNIYQVAWVHKTASAPHKTSYFLDPVETTQPVFDHSRVYIGLRAHTVLCLDKQSGSLVWEYQADSRIDGALTIGNDMVIAGDINGKVYFINKYSGTLKWSYGIAEPLISPPLVHGDQVIFLTARDKVVSLSLRDGSEMWFHRHTPTVHLEETLSGGYTPQVLPNGLIAIGSSDGQLKLFDSSKGRLVTSIPVLDDPHDKFRDLDVTGVGFQNIIYLASWRRGLLALDLRTQLSYPVYRGEGVATPPILTESDRVIYFCTTRGVVHAYQLDSSGYYPTVLWQYDLGQTRPGFIAVSGSYLLASLLKGDLFFLDRFSGKKLDQLPIGSGLSTGIAVDGGDVYVLTNAGNFYKITLTPQDPLKN